MSILPNRLKELREQSKLTQEEVAKIIEVDFTTVSKHENMDRSIKAEDLQKYARLYKIQTHEIFFTNADLVEGEEFNA